MKKKPHVSIVLVNYNGEKDTIECVESLSKITYENYSIIVVDNGSNKGNIRCNSRINKLADVIILSSNLGFSGGNNKGIEYALKKYDSEYILLLNNDTLVEKDFLDKLVYAAEDNPNAIIGGTIYYEYDRSLIWYAGGEFIKDTALTIHCRYNEHMMKNTLSSRDVTFITGCLMLIPKEVISKVGLLPEEHFLYFEDADYCCSALEKNIRLLYCSTAVIYHKVNASAKTNSPVQNYYMVRNGLYMVRKYSHHKWKGYARIFRKEAKRCLRKNNSFKMLCISTYDFLMGRQGKATF